MIYFVFSLAGGAEGRGRHPPSEQGRQAEEQGRIGQGQDVQCKLDAIEGSQFGDRSAQQQGSDEDGAPRPPVRRPGPATRRNSRKAAG